MGAMIMPMIQNLEATLRNNAAPHTMQFVPTPASLSVPKPTAATATAASKTPTSSTTAAAASAAPTGSSSKQEEEKKRRLWLTLSAALMASGTLRASEAAALAMRRVMERHGDGASMQA
ncbi:hypothetical protein VPH35_113507 [Triticum aestivum]